LTKLPVGSILFDEMAWSVGLNRPHKVHKVTRVISQSGWLLAAGILFVLAGIRDWVAPGFLSIAGRHWGWLDIAVNLLAGAVFIVVAVQKSGRQERN
jgi:hypothetical protein